MGGRGDGEGYGAKRGQEPPADPGELSGSGGEWVRKALEWQRGEGGGGARIEGGGGGGQSWFMVSTGIGS